MLTRRCFLCRRSISANDVAGMLTPRAHLRDKTSTRQLKTSILKGVTISDMTKRTLYFDVTSLLPSLVCGVLRILISSAHSRHPAVLDKVAFPTTCAADIASFRLFATSISDLWTISDIVSWLSYIVSCFQRRVRDPTSLHRRQT
jgi:hypothetical protein